MAHRLVFPPDCKPNTNGAATAIEKSNINIGVRQKTNKPWAVRQQIIHPITHNPKNTEHSKTALKSPINRLLLCVLFSLMTRQVQRPKCLHKENEALHPNCGKNDARKKKPFGAPSACIRPEYCWKFGQSNAQAVEKSSSFPSILLEKQAHCRIGCCENQKKNSILLKIGAGHDQPAGRGGVVGGSCAPKRPLSTMGNDRQPMGPICTQC